MENLGVRTSIPNKYGRYIYELLKGINIEEYIWNLNDDEIILDNEASTGLFIKSKVDGEEFLKGISLNEYYIVNAEISAYATIDGISNINNYNDFKNSKCEILMYLIDSQYVEIYCKDSINMDKVVDNIKRMNLICEYITKSNIRESLSIF